MGLKSILKRYAKRHGQGMVEYAGAWLVAAMIVLMLVQGIQDNNWMYNAYNAIFNGAGNMMSNAVSNL